jgi:S1 RNA binding domain protein
MEFEVGAIMTGKVTGITKFGAFVTLVPGKSGLVHISEIANSYVSEVSAFLSEGQEVQVKLIGIDQAGRLNLSIKQAQEDYAPPRAAAPSRAPAPRRYDAPQGGQAVSAPSMERGEQSFEDKLKRFMQDSDSKISDLKHYNDKRGNRRRRGD